MVATYPNLECTCVSAGRFLNQGRREASAQRVRLWAVEASYSVAEGEKMSSKTIVRLYASPQYGKSASYALHN